MTENQCYDIPLLDLSEILACLHEGVLGQIATNMTAEHLKNPTPAVMMQLCASILDKVDVEVDTLCHPRLDSSMELKHPDNYLNSFKVVHVAMLVKRVLPEYGANDFQLTDLTSPRWKRVRKFLCAALNYFKSWDMNMKMWDKIYSKTAEAVAEHQKLKDEVSSLESEISELETYNINNQARRQEMKGKRDQINKELEECHRLKEEKLLVKESVKKKFSDLAAAVEKKTKQIDALKAEKEKLLMQVVDSPKRYMSEKQMFDKKMKMVQELHAEWQGKLNEAERKNTAMQSMEQLLMDAAQTANDNKGIKENKKKLESEIQAQTHEIENCKLSMVGDAQDIANLKQQIASSREKLSRMSVRWNQRNSEFTNTMEILSGERDVLKSQAGDIHADIKKMETEIKMLQAQYQEIQDTHKHEMDEMKLKQAKIMEAMDAYHIAMTDKLRSSEICRILRNKENAKAQSNNI